MKQRQIISKAARLVSAANAFILDALKQAGVEDIVPAHGDILSVLFKEGQVSVTHLAESTGRTKSTVSILVDKLENRGYVSRQRSPMDGRALLIGLTEKGEALRPLFETISSSLNAQVIQGLSAQEAEILEVSLARVLLNFN